MLAKASRVDLTALLEPQAEPILTFEDGNILVARERIRNRAWR